MEISETVRDVKLDQLWRISFEKIDLFLFYEKKIDVCYFCFF